MSDEGAADAEALHLTIRSVLLTPGGADRPGRERRDLAGMDSHDVLPSGKHMPPVRTGARFRQAQLVEVRGTLVERDAAA